jgi:hypothetical protein
MATIERNPRPIRRSLSLTQHEDALHYGKTSVRLPIMVILLAEVLSGVRFSRNCASKNQDFEYTS